MTLKYLIPLLAVGMLAFLSTFLLARRFAITIMLMALGFLLVWKTSWFLDIFGRVPWAEKHLGSGLGAGLGGSWGWYKLLGIIIIAAAILHLTGLLQSIVVRLLGPFFGGAAI